MLRPPRRITDRLQRGDEMVALLGPQPADVESTPSLPVLLALGLLLALPTFASDDDDDD